MTTIDTSGNIHRSAGALGGGQFAGKANSAPAVTLAPEASSPAAPAADVLARRRAAAAGLHLAAKHTYLLANRDAATAVLREQFPWATHAIFTRSWDDPEERIVLAELLGPEGRIVLAEPALRSDGPLNTQDDDDSHEEFSKQATREQLAALRDARLWVAEMGEDVSGYLDEGEVSHEGWHEYQLNLTAIPEDSSPAGMLLDQLDASGRSMLDEELSERDGRMASVVDTREMAHQLTQGSVSELDPELTASLIATFGSVERAADAIADSSAWFQFREETGDALHARIPDAIYTAATAVLTGEGA